MHGKFERRRETKPLIPNFNPNLTLPGWLFTTGMVFYNELMLHLWVAESFSFGRFLAVILFALGFGAVLGLICSLFPSPKASKRAAIGISFFVVVLYLTEYFLSDAYQVFMTVATIFAGAGGVAQDYFGLIVSVLGRNLWRIGLMLLPIFLYGFFCRSTATRWNIRAVLAGAAVVLYLAGFGAVRFLTHDSAVMNKAYNFDGAVRKLGLNMGLALDVVNGMSANEEPEFAQLEVPPAPAVTESTEPQEDAGDEPAVVYEDNVMDIDFAALAETERDAHIQSMHKYVASLTPTKQNEYTGLFEGKNLIMITAEAFSAEVIDPELTPTLYRMATEGIQFKEYYQPAWGASTTTGEFSNLMGIVPNAHGGIMMETRQQNFFLTLGHQSQKLNYFTAAYHNHLHDFYNRHLTHEKLGYDNFYARYGMKPLEGIKGVWPESDLEMMDVTVPQYIDNQPFSIYYMTVSGHCLYTQNENAMTKKNWDQVQHLEHSDIVKGYYAANLELEYAMASLIRQLEEAGIADDTVIVMATDHYPYGLERSSTWQNTVDHLAELYGVSNYDQYMRDHNALIIWSGCIEDMDIVVDTPVYSLDILPTVSNLFGFDYDSRLLVGRDVFSDAEPLVLWPDHSWITDKGTFDFDSGIFTPREGAEVDDGYVDRISAIVANKITYSRTVLDKDYFRKLSDSIFPKE